MRLPAPMTRFRDIAAMALSEVTYSSKRSNREVVNQGCFEAVLQLASR
jgi:hypothetical protein